MKNDALELVRASSPVYPRHSNPDTPHSPRLSTAPKYNRPAFSRRGILTHYFQGVYESAE